MHKVVIVDTSPLFYLYRLGHLDLFEKLYGQIIIPQAVVDELEEGENIGEDVPVLADHKWIRVKRVTIPTFIKMIPDLGSGEAEVLALGGARKLIHYSSLTMHWAGR